jgi:hypothetical protein
MAVDVGATTAEAALEDVGAGAFTAKGVAAANRVVDATSRLLPRTVRSATGALIRAGFGPVFIDVLPDAEWEVPRSLRRASVPGASAVDADEPAVVLMSGPPEMFAAPCGFLGRG